MLKIAGEIGTKSARTRRRFLRVLAANVRAALRHAGLPAEVESRWSRLFVRVPDPARARDALSTVFGLHSISEVAVLRYEDLGDLVEQAAALYRDRVAGKTFAVRARRSGEPGFSSRDVAVKLGDALLVSSAGVNLDAPEVEVPIEVVAHKAYAILEGTPGAKGLPLGSGHSAVALFSGGFDSPPAAWMAMRRGTALDLVVCDLDGCGGPEAAMEVARVMTERWAPGLPVRAHLVDLAPVVEALRERVDSRLRQVLLKRAMYRVGTLVAKDVGGEAIVTGEVIGQVSTQTLRNLAVAEEAAGVPVLRPLIGMDKEEIIALARRIGTHDASVRVREHCAISTGRVETGARLDEVLTAEGEVDESFIDAAVSGRRQMDVAAWRPGPRPAHLTDEVPPGAVVVDVREPEEGPDVGDLRLPFSLVDRWVETLDRDTQYVFHCTYGVRSELVARELTERGYRALALAGGTAAIHRAA
jgi:thiamine biosynthesis protein ThiI